MFLQGHNSGNILFLGLNSNAEDQESAESILELAPNKPCFKKQNLTFFCEACGRRKGQAEVICGSNKLQEQ